MKDQLTILSKATEQYADRYSMLECTDIIVAYSGGADSTLLLYLLREICKRRGIRITAAHVNHMLRAEEADRDAEFCREVCSRYAIDLRLLKVDVASLAQKRRQSEELCARETRYGFFEEIRRELESEGARVKIATAHNATDNAETVIFNLARGTALTGMCGIPPVRDGYIIRPILQLSKEQVTEYCDMLGLEYVTDRTNASTEYSRNKIRHLVLPVLREIDPSLEQAVSRASESIRADSEYLDLVASDAYRKAKHEDMLCANALAALPPAILSRVICLFADENGAAYENLHIRECVRKITEGKDFSLSLIGKRRLQMREGKIKVSEDTREAPMSDSWQIPLNIGKNSLPDGSLIYLFSKKEDAERIKTQNVYKLFIQQTLSGDTIDNVFLARSRRDGDTISSGGHTHKIKKLLSDKKIPKDKRGALPMLLRDGRIVWIPGVRIADGEGKSNNCVYAIYIKH